MGQFDDPTDVTGATPATPLPRPGVVLVFDGQAPTYRVVPLGAGLTIGRGPENDLVVDHRGVSRRHARIDVAGGRAWVTDVGSSGGTRVDGRRIGERTPLDGARLVACGPAMLLPVADVAPYEAWELRVDGGYILGPTHARSLRTVERIARTGHTFLITGESGSGKEETARRFHALSPNRRGPFVVVNAANLSTELADGHIFGWKRGAFTGARADAPGYLRAAAGGTVFFDEVGDLEPAVQVKLLRAIETKTVTPLGSTREEPVDVQFVGATNLDVYALARGGRYRGDLVARLATTRVHLAPLRDRREEIPWHLARAIADFCQRLGVPPLPMRHCFVEACLLRMWLGQNVRGVVGAVHVAVDRALDAGDERLTALHLPADVEDAPPEPEADQVLVPPPPAAMTPALATTPTDGAHTTSPVVQAKRRARKARSEEAVARHGGDRDAVCAELGISRATLSRWLAEG